MNLLISRVPQINERSRDKNNEFDDETLFNSFIKKEQIKKFDKICFKRGGTWD